MKTFKFKLKVSYELYLLAKANDEDTAVDDIEKQIRKLDDYEVVNRATDKKAMEIVEIVEVSQYADSKPKKKK